MRHNRIKGAPDKGWCEGAGPLPAALAAAKKAVVLAAATGGGDSENGHYARSAEKHATLPLGAPQGRAPRTLNSADRVSALHRWRNKVAREQGFDDTEALLTATALRQIAFANPTTVEALYGLAGLSPLWIATFGEDVVRTLLQS